MSAPAVASAPRDKSEAILEAALELFVERGFHGTSVPSVAERAGVAAGTIYHYFESKEALVNALFKQWKMAIGAKMLDGFPHDGPPRDQFLSIWKRMAEFAVQHPRELAFIELHHHKSYLDAESTRVEQQLHEFGLAMVERAQTAKVLKPLPAALLLELANGAFVGVFRAMREGRIPLSHKNLMAAERCVWEAIRA